MGELWVADRIQEDPLLARLSALWPTGSLDDIFHIFHILHLFFYLYLHISHFRQQVVSIKDPRRSSQGLSIFDPRGKKASPLQRYPRYFNLCMMFNVFKGFSTSTWNTAEVFQLVLDISISSELCWSQEREPLVQHDHKKASRRTCRGLERCVIWRPVGGGSGKEDDQSCNILYILIYKGT